MSGNLFIKCFLLLMAGLLVSGMGRAHAAVIEGVTFPDSVQAGAMRLKLQGTGLLRYKILFRGYVAALYHQDPTPKDGTPQGRRLEIEYFWDIPAEEFRIATRKGIQMNTSSESYAALVPDIRAFNQFYRDIRSGDRYSLTYMPTQGTELALNGQALGSISGNIFANALFGIWLGAQPLDESLKKKLLGDETS